MHLWGYQDTDMSGDFLHSFFEARCEIRSSQWERSAVSRCCPCAACEGVVWKYEIAAPCVKLCYSALGILRWQPFYSTWSLFMWNISALRVHWRQSGVLWQNGLIIKPIPWLKNITGHPLVDKWEVALPPLRNTLSYKLNWRRFSVFIYFIPHKLKKSMKV